MKVIREMIGNTIILIQTVEDDLELVGEAQIERATQLTGIGEEAREAYAQAKSIIKNIAEDIGTELGSIRAMARPKEVEMEFSMGISAQAGSIWILSGKGEYGLKVKMTWELGVDERTS